MKYIIKFEDIAQRKPTHYVYEIRDNDGIVLYVGKTKNPRQRLYQHVKIEPKSKGNGTFYKRSDVSLHVIDKFLNSTDAITFETELKIKYGFEVTERQNFKNYYLKTKDKRDKREKDVLKLYKEGHSANEISLMTLNKIHTVYRIIRLNKHKL